MRTWKAKVDCVGFKGKRWRKGEIVELENFEVPPHHFELVSRETPKEVKVTDSDQVALSQIHQPKKVPNGFAYKAEETDPKVIEVKKRGRKPKEK